MAVIRSYNQPTVEARPAPNAGVPMNAPVAAFGNAAQTEGNARATQVAGAYLDRAADTTANMALSMMEEANEARVQELANNFMSGTQFTLYTDKDAFYRKRGQDAINGAQQATDKLLELKRDTVGLAANDTQRRRLTKMLDAQMIDVTNGISRYVSTQSMEWQKNVATARQQLLLNQTGMQWGDVDAVEKNAIAAESVAKEQARQLGAQPGDDVEKSMMAAARSNHFATAITQMVQNGQPRAALALHDRVKDRLDEKDATRIDGVMKSIRTDVAADDWIARQQPDEGRREVRRFFEAKGYTPEQASALAGHAMAESGARPGARNRGDGRDGSDSIGLFQWNSDRARNLQNFARDNKLDPWERSTQLEFAAWELANTESDAGKKIKGAKSLEEANAAVFGYLRPAKQTGRLDLAQAALADKGVGSDKANASALVLAAQNDPNLTPAEKVAITTKISKQSVAMEATRSATIKGLDDMLEAETIAMIASPSTATKGRLAILAQGYRDAGERSKANVAALLASMEDTILSFATAPKSAQDEITRSAAASLLPGKAKALADSLSAAGKKDRTEATKQAGEDFSALKSAASNTVRIETMAPKAQSIVDSLVKTGEFAKAREVEDWFNAQVAAQAAGQAPAAGLAKAASEMKTRIEEGEQTNAAILQLDALERVKREQASGFAKDALSYGAGVYSRDLGPLPPASDFAARVAYAEQISQRQGGMKVLPFTEPEIAQGRTALDNGTPEQQSKALQTFAQLPASAIPGVAEALAGKDSANRTTRGYAAALSFFAEKDPNSRAIGNEILDGIRILKADADSTRKPESKSDAWSATLKDTMENLFRDTPQLRAAVEDGAALVYISRMHRAGKQGDRLDIDVLRGAIRSVVGDPVELRGQYFLPPVRGMTSYDVSKALRSLSDGDLDGLRTEEGTPITASVIQNRGILTNGRNGEGWYFVRIPDPRAGFDPRPIMTPDGKDLFQLDLRPLIERAARFPDGLAPLPDAAIRARARAPSSPTEGLAP